MRISEIFNLGVNQAQLDFVDIDISIDIPLFIDPYFLSIRNDFWSINADRTVKSFFQYVIDLVIGGNIAQAKQLFTFLHEPKETCLGLGRDSSEKGKGIGSDDTEAIFEKILESKAIETGLVKDLEDTVIFVDKVGKDKVSDMVTNIIRRHLIEYTQQQCQLWDIPLTGQCISGEFWDGGVREWRRVETDMLLIDNRPILLVPKAIVSYFSEYTTDKYYQHFVLNYLQGEHLRLGTSLVRQIGKNNRNVVFKKDVDNDIRLKIEDGEYINKKNYIREFSLKHPDIFENFKHEISKNIDSISNEELLEDLDVKEMIDYLIKELKDIPTGTSYATKYHRYIKGVLELIFYPNLIRPTIEQAIHNGRKRVDITFDNGATCGAFYRLHDIRKLPCQFIFVECKNYAKDIANPELDQLSGRFSVLKGQVGLLLCRTIDSMELFIDRCRDTYLDGRGLIIPVVDDDIIYLLSRIKENELDLVNEFMESRIRKIMLG